MLSDECLLITIRILLDPHLMVTIIWLHLLASLMLVEPLMADPGPVPLVINTYTMIFTLLIDKVISIILGHAFSTLYFAHRALH